MTWRRECKEGERLGLIWGCAWHDFSRNVSVCYPLGSHWLVRWAMGLHMRLFRRWKPSRWERELMAARSDERKRVDDLNDGLRSALDRCRDVDLVNRQKSYGHGWDDAMTWLGDNVGKPDEELAKSRNRGMKRYPG